MLQQKMEEQGTLRASCRGPIIQKLEKVRHYLISPNSDRMGKNKAMYRPLIHLSQKD